ncbi:hypothetical protein TNIN_395281 [Trichonephila inaurata madagascariensis]|uniref:Uncharacterized protein n=1 Tax=Trichonephila inaurata madagascariensis TaxID=2747483 RepID=A0A8X6YSY5_9ARAC|nr:hypothetical protein TNIN_395281 [Trichonephila inaurata madagascariensis]
MGLTAVMCASDDEALPLIPDHSENLWVKRIHTTLKPMAKVKAHVQFSELGSLQAHSDSNNALMVHPATHGPAYVVVQETKHVSGKSLSALLHGLIRQTHPVVTDFACGITRPCRWLSNPVCSTLLLFLQTSNFIRIWIVRMFGGKYRESAPPTEFRSCFERRNYGAHTAEKTYVSHGITSVPTPPQIEYNPDQEDLEMAGYSSGVHLVPAAHPSVSSQNRLATEIVQNLQLPLLKSFKKSFCNRTIRRSARPPERSASLAKA